MSEQPGIDSNEIQHQAVEAAQRLVPAEGLGPNEDGELKGTYAAHKSRADKVEEYSTALADSRRSLIDKPLERLAAVQGLAVSNDHYDQNIEYAARHKDEHLDIYIETARQEAESQA